ncbi:hypothetical protein ACN28I_20505 [Archangium gephyra]|uniref:hypothetical protein n=1 Tax=Archangium gephyra TaxID=48 RepID=UPI003B7F3055
MGDHDATLGKLMAGRQAITANAEMTSLMEDMTQHVAQHRQQAYSVLGKLGQTMGVGGAGTGNNGTGMQKGTEPGTGGHMGSGHTGGGHMGTGTGSGTTGTGQPGSGMQQPKK